VGALDTVKRKKVFKSAVAKPLTVRDSRFGLRKMYLNPNESPSIAVFNTPGKGINGEHQN